MRASLIVPTLNEAASIGGVLAEFRAAAERANETLFSESPLTWEVVVVDGASADGTAEIALHHGARVVTERRKGYGRAYRTGFSVALGEVIATSDGDGTYPVATIPGLVRRLIDESLDFINGDRLAGVDRSAMTAEHRIGNRVLNATLRLAYRRYVRDGDRVRIRDSQSGFWVFRRALLDRLVLTQDGMALSEEIKIEALVRGFRVLEVPIDYGRRADAPKLSSWRDGLRNEYYLIRKRLDLARELRTPR